MRRWKISRRRRRLCGGLWSREMEEIKTYQFWKGFAFGVFALEVIKGLLAIGILIVIYISS